jgi:hypothetical protein
MLSFGSRKLGIRLNIIDNGTPQIAQSNNLHHSVMKNPHIKKANKNNRPKDIKNNRISLKVDSSRNLQSFCMSDIRHHNSVISRK